PHNASTRCSSRSSCSSVSFTATPPTEIYTLSLHDALPISFDHDRAECHAGNDAVASGKMLSAGRRVERLFAQRRAARRMTDDARSEEHTSELQSRGHLVCRLLLEKKKKKQRNIQSKTGTTD